MEAAKALEQERLTFYSENPDRMMDLSQYESFRDSENSDVALKLLSEDDLAKYERRHMFECAKFWKGKTFYTYEV